MTVDSGGWSGDGDFTRRLIDVIGALDGIELLKVEDAPSSRGDAAFSFISNEIFVVFGSRSRREAFRRLGFIPGTRTIEEKALSLEGLASALAGEADVGEPDYSDDGMLQYLRTQRIVPPYQTRGYKLVELVRIYEGCTRPTAEPPNDRKISG